MKRRVLFFVPITLALAYLVVPGWADAGGPILNSYNLSAVVSAGALLVGIAIQRPRPLWPWLTIAGSLLLWVAGDAVYIALGTSPAISIADAFYIAGYVGLIVAMLAFVRARTRQRDTDSLIDAALVGAAGLLAIWELIIEPALQTTDGSLAGQIVSALYPLLDLVLLVMLVRLLLVPGRRVRAALLLAAGMGMVFLADTIYLVLLQSDSYQGVVGRVLDATWLMGYALFPMAVLTKRMRDLTTEAIPGEQSMLGSLFVAGAALLSIPVVAIAARTLGRDTGIETLVLSAVTIVPLVLWRFVRLTRAGERARAAIADQKSYYHAVANNSSDAFVLIAEDGTIIDASGALAALLGYDGAEAIGADGLSLIVDEDREHAEALLSDSIAKPGVTVVGEVRMQTAAGVRLWVELRCTNLLANPAVGGVVVNTHDITGRKEAERDLEHQAFHDALTGLANRSLLKNRLDHALVQRDRGVDVAAIFCDLDGFKDVNDRLGHDAGDHLLRVVAERFTRAVRPGDTVARVGGDEFGVILEGGQHLADEANVVAQRMLSALSDPLAIEGVPVVVTGSIGLAIASEGNQTEADDLFRDADTAMYGAKANGRNQVMHYQPSMGDAALRRARVAVELRGVVERDELVMRYQPQFSLTDRRLVGFEALVRWQHPTRGLLGAEEFIPIAEQSDLIVEIGTWVLESACRRAAEWRHFGHGAAPAMSVNLSARQLVSPALNSTVVAALAASGLPAGALVLELTESLLVEHPDEVAVKLRALKELGVRLAIDDFGVGYSSLSYLRQFPIDILKIDRSFVEGIQSADGVPAIVRGLLELARTLGLETVAEGIETDAQLDALTAEGCDVGQGYWFARPLDEAAAAELVRTALPRAPVAA